MMKIQIGVMAFLVAISMASLFEFGMASPNTVPAFLWSPHLQSTNEAVNYQVISAKDLVGSVFTQGGWSNFLCSEKKKLEQPVDVALMFIGRELLSTDVSSTRNSDPTLVNTLNNLFTASNFSLAFPYISAPEEERMENLLLSGLKEACSNNVGVSNIVFSDSCFVEDGTIQKLSGLQSFKDHLLTRRETRKDGETDLVVVCSEGSESKSQAGQSHSEHESISELVNSVEESGSKYTALYVSDPYWYTSYKTLQRFLAETAKGNSTSEVTTGCDELCKFKSSLLEGILVGIVFLLILISGLCCMAGIDTPTRFETPQDS
ncbi:hypothetical protein CARUB_v10014210mg [Capsella rubella]|uniref:V-type proton ATPase subunit S1/VOA1 transmembrane domain-containing protein n=1 Tax=Capsella rubella TaxID=81985 RepID=R0I424_9BRAS|nr:uncharacterized protein LOC17891420 [Capsella rubella]EOA31058.1 hypothetical protein CARUB_v10014210mg [Capsella rubella]